MVLTLSLDSSIKGPVTKTSIPNAFNFAGGERTVDAFVGSVIPMASARSFTWSSDTYVIDSVGRYATVGNIVGLRSDHIMSGFNIADALSLHHLSLGLKSSLTTIAIPGDGLKELDQPFSMFDVINTEACYRLPSSDSFRNKFLSDLQLSLQTDFFHTKRREKVSIALKELFLFASSVHENDDLAEQAQRIVSRYGPLAIKLFGDELFSSAYDIEDVSDLVNAMALAAEEEEIPDFMQVMIKLLQSENSSWRYTAADVLSRSSNDVVRWALKTRLKSETNRTVRAAIQAGLR